MDQKFLLKTRIEELRSLLFLWVECGFNSCMEEVAEKFIEDKYDIKDNPDVDIPDEPTQEDYQEFGKCLEEEDIDTSSIGFHQRVVFINLLWKKYWQLLECVDEMENPLTDELRGKLHYAITRIIRAISTRNVHFPKVAVCVENYESCFNEIREYYGISIKEEINQNLLMFSDGLLEKYKN